MDWLSLSALLWAAAFAADNLSELKAARIAELLPLIDVGLRRGYDQGEPQLVLSFRNLGRGHAAGFEAVVYQLDLDKLYWVPDRLSELPDLIAPAEVLREVRQQNDWIKYALQNEPCDLIVEVTFRDPLGKHHKLPLGFKIGHLTDEMQEVEPPPRPPIDHKLDVIRRRLKDLEVELHLADEGWSLTVDSDLRQIVVNLLAEGGTLLGWYADFGVLVSDLIDRVHRHIEEHRRAT